MPKQVYHAYGVVKKAAITRVADDAVAGKLDAHFPPVRLADRLRHSLARPGRLRRQ